MRVDVVSAVLGVVVLDENQHDLLAILVNQKMRGMAVFRTIYFSPIVTPLVVVAVVVAAIFWSWLWGPIGLLGRWLDPLGLQPMFRPAGVLLAHLFVTFPYMLGTVKPLLDELETTYEEAAYTIVAKYFETAAFGSERANSLPSGNSSVSA